MKFLLDLPQHIKKQLLLAIFGAGTTFVLLAIRILSTRSISYGFLVWNLFLAFIPWFLSAAILSKQQKTITKSTVALLVLWVLFLPNTFYLATDLVHLAYINGIERTAYDEINFPRPYGRGISGFKPIGDCFAQHQLGLAGLYSFV